MNSKTPNPNNDELIRFKSCSRKRAYPTLDCALLWAAYLSDPSKYFDAYRCLYCMEFHLTTKLMTPEQINNNFTYHTPKGDQPKRFKELRDKARELAELINEICPESREKSVAFTNLETSVFWANAAIIRNE